MKNLYTAAVVLSIALSQTAFAADYVSVQMEAENYSQKNSLWRLFSNSSKPNIKPDPDSSHHSSASGKAYLELLPDTRVTHSDSLNTGRNFWPNAGTGPSISYTVNFPEAGRYTVWVKAYSTGTEDNGIHVGINNSNPASGARVQWCSGKNSWTWSSAQRASNNHCGVPRSIYLDVAFAGANTVTFSAREDGFEFDQFMLIKENAAGLRCEPTGNDKISCNKSATGNTTNNDNQNNNNQNDNSQNDNNTDTDDNTQQQDTGDTPACQSALSDADGDGYGWENNRSCLVSVDSTTSNDNSSSNTCSSAAADPDGDGWGWENNRSCQVNGSDTDSTTNDGADSDDTPVCSSSNSDSDGDGWGWEQNRSCVVR